MNFSQVERGSLKPCGCVRVYMNSLCVCVGWNVHVFRADLNVSTVKKSKMYCLYQPPNVLMSTAGCVCVFASMCDITANLL